MEVTVLARMKTIDNETLLVEKKELEAISRYIDELEKRTFAKEVEKTLASSDIQALQRKIDSYEKNKLCKAIVRICDWCRSVKRYFKEKKHIKIKHQFELITGGDK